MAPQTRSLEPAALTRRRDHPGSARFCCCDLGLALLFPFAACRRRRGYNYRRIEGPYAEEGMPLIEMKGFVQLERV